MRENDNGGVFLNFLLETLLHRFLQKEGHMVKYSFFFFFCCKMRGVPPPKRDSWQACSMQTETVKLQPQQAHQSW